MGECIITRSGGGNVEVISPDIGIFLLTLLDSNNIPISNVYANCNDAGVFYNFATNSNGQVIYTNLKSGYANIAIKSEYSNGVMMADQMSNGWYNIEAPLGKNTKATCTLQKVSNNNIINGNYMFRVTDRINLNIAGGGGGAGGRYTIYRNDSSKWDYYYGGAGGAAALNIKNNIPVDKNIVYTAIVGMKGNSGNSGYWDFRDRPQTHQNATSGRSGGTTSFLNYSATGGGGGSPAEFSGNGSDGTSYGSWRSNGYINIDIL